MKKNVAGQAIGAQMVSATDGSEFTGSVTVYVTGDAGTQAAGSVSSGACTHEGHGYHTYAPAQAETNYDIVAFTFTGTGAVPATVQCATFFPQTVDNATNISSIKTTTDKFTFTVANQVDSNVLDWKSSTAPAMTGDAYARLGAPAGASVSADIAAVKVDTAAVKVQTDKLTFTVANQVDSNVLDWKSSTAPAMTGDAYARLGAPAGASVSVDVAAVKTDTAAIKTKTDSLTFTVAGLADANVVDWKGVAAPAMTGDAYARLGAPAGASVSADIATVATYVDTEVAAIKAKTDNLPASPAAVGSAMTLTSGERDSVADALLNRNVSGGSSTGRTVKQALHFLRNKWAIVTGTLTVYDTDDSTSSWTATVSTDAAANPIITNDPA